MLAVLALVASVLGLTGADLVDRLTGRMMPVPWSSAVTVVAVAAVLTGWTVWFRRKVRATGQRVDPFVAVRTAALAMAASRAGAIIAGLFGGIGLWYFADLSVPVAQERAVICAVGVIASIALVVAALWLERSCRLPDEPDAPPGEFTRSDDGGDWVHPRTSSR
jgi:lysylphosphatidylglycerol synthetase-like protein (DUF2156 family)